MVDENVQEISLESITEESMNGLFQALIAAGKPNDETKPTEIEAVHTKTTDLCIYLFKKDKKKRELYSTVNVHGKMTQEQVISILWRVSIHYGMISKIYTQKPI